MGLWNMIFLFLFGLTALVAGCPPPLNDMRFLANATHSTRDLIMAYRALDPGGTGYLESTSNNGDARTTWPGGLIEFCFVDEDQEDYLRHDIEAAWKLWTDKIGVAGEHSGHSLVFRDYEFTDSFNNEKGQHSWAYCYNKRQNPTDPLVWNPAAPNDIFVIRVSNGNALASVPGYIPKSYSDAQSRHEFDVIGSEQRASYIAKTSYDFWISQLAHELGHAFGLQHEHQRSDRAQYVEYNCDALRGAAEARDEVDRLGNVDDWGRVCHDPILAGEKYNWWVIHEFGVLPSKDEKGNIIHSTMGGEYDKDSIMHYHSMAFWPGWSSNPDSRTCLDKPLSFWKNGGPNFQLPDFTEENDLEFIYPRLKPSDGDYRAIKELYPWAEPMDECDSESSGSGAQNSRRQTSGDKACPPRNEPLPYPFATEEYFGRCKCKGEAFLKAMHDSDADAGILFTPVRASAESEFNSAASLATWGWKDFKVSPISIDYQKHWAIDHVLKALGLSDKSVALGGTIQVHGVSHGDEDLDGGGFGNVPYDEQAAYIVGEKSYRVSGSEYTFGIDPAGVLIAMDRKSPRFAGQERYPKVEGDQLPKLQSFSDVAWSKWVSTAGKPTTMRYFLSLAIGNFETRSVIGKILNDARNTWQPAWPGVTFSTDTPQGAALLGTPNALAFSYFLIQHKSGLGNLRISKVTIFKDGRRFADPCLLFHVEAAPVLPKEPEKARSLEAQGLKQTSVNSYVRRHDLRAKL